MSTLLVVDALTDHGMMPTANPRAKDAMHQDRRAQYGLPVMPCPGRSRVIKRAIMIYGRIAQ